MKRPADQKTSCHKADGDDPGYWEDDKQAFRCVNTSKSRKNPYDSYQTGADDGNYSWKSGVSGTAQNACSRFVESADGFEEQNDANPHAGGFNDCRIGGKKAGRSGSEDRQWYRDESAEQEGTGKADAKNVSAASDLACGIVLAGKCCGSLPEGCDDKIPKVFKVHGDGASGCGNCPEAVDGRLNKNIGEAEDCALYGRGNADHQNLCKVVLMKTERTNPKLKFIGFHVELPKNQKSGDSGGDTGCGGHSGNACMTANDKQKVQQDVQNTGQDQCDKRKAAVAFGAQDSRSKIIEHEERKSAKINPQVEYCCIQDLFRRPDQCEQRAGDALPENNAQRSCEQRKHQRCM